MRIFLAIIGSMLLMSPSMSAMAQDAWRQGERQALWPEGRIPDFQAHQIGAMTDEPTTNAEWRAAHTMPYLEWFDPPQGTNVGCMILISGGSYNKCCDVSLIKKWRDVFTKHGFQTVNLVYRTPRPVGLECFRSAWQDGQRAVRLVRAVAAQRGFDSERIGVIGMSAGGHLATLLATTSLTAAYERVDEMDDLPCHINWCVANAPAYNTLGGADGSARPQDGTTEIPTINPVFAFDAKTCPISFHHGGADIYTPNGSTLCYRELRKRGIPSELHLYADNPHGAYGLGRAEEFMRQLGFMGPLESEVLLMDRYPTDEGRGSCERQEVWPEGKMPNAQTNQCQPYIEWHMPEELKSKAIQIIYSGGAYRKNTPDNYEVAPMRRLLNSRGVTVVTLKYRTPRATDSAKHLCAWQDLQRTIRLVRKGAVERGLDPDRIGIMGSSAGGHLSLLGALSSMTPAYERIDEIDDLSCRVQWAVAIYPAYVLSDGVDGKNAHGGNLNEDVFVPELSFDAASCPCVFVHGDADGVAAMNSVKCWEKLRSMGIQCDLHTLALRDHSFQRKASPGTGSYTWMERIWEFLKRKQFL